MRRVLHLGCGDGSLTVRLPGDCIIGVESDENRAAVKWPDKPGLRFFVREPGSLTGVADMQCDLAVITDVFAEDEIEQTLTLAWGLLHDAVREDGFIICDHALAASPPSLPARRLDRLVYPVGSRLHLLELYKL